MTESNVCSEITNDRYRECIKNILANHLPMIQEKSGAYIIDVGCGSGEVTVEILLPSLPPTFKQLIGADILEEMVEYAKKKYSTKPVEFMIVDIEADKISPELVGKFDNLFSFFCLQNVTNQRQCFSNFNKLLSTGGDMLLTFIANDPICHCYKVLYQTEKWKKHMKYYDKCVKTYLYADDPEKKLSEILELSGFTTKVCKLMDFKFPYQDKTMMKKVCIAIEPMVETISENIRDDFLNDVLQALTDNYDCTDEMGNIALLYKLFVVVAQKKKNLQQDEI